MNQLDIYCFTSIARTKSFSITARELMISQQAVSNHIKTLEEEVGYPLFFRSGQSATLTKAGEIMLDYFIKRDSLASEFFHNHPAKIEEMPFKLAWTQWAGCPDILEEMLEEFHAQNPDIQFLIHELSAENTKTALKERTIDFLFTSKYSAEYLSTFWEQTFICKQELYLVRSRRIEYDETDLGKYPLFTMPAGESNSHTIIERAKKTCQQIGFTPRNIQICQDLGTACLNVLTSDGLTFGTLPPEKLPENNFITVPTGIFSDYIMCCPYYSENPGINKFKDFIHKKVATIPHRPMKEVES